MLRWFLAQQTLLTRFSLDKTSISYRLWPDIGYFAHMSISCPQKRMALRGGVKKNIFFTFSQKKLRPPPPFF